MFVAPETLQARVLNCPGAIVDGVAVKEVIVGAAVGGVTVTVA